MPPRRPADDGQPPATQAGPGSQPRGGRAEPKVLGMPRNVAIGGGVAFVAALVWFIWHRKKATAAASTSTATSTATGTPPYSGLPSWLYSTSTGTGTGTGGGGGGVFGGGTSTGTGTGTGTSTATGTSTSTTTTTNPTPTAGWSYPAPTGLQVTSKAATGYYLKWNAVKGPQGQTPPSYTVATYNGSGTEVNQHDTVPGSTQTAEYGKGGKGLPKGTYHTNVWANGGPVAPPHASTPDVILTR